MTKEQRVEKFNRIVEKLRQSKEYKKAGRFFNRWEISDIQLFQGIAGMVSIKFNNIDVTRDFNGDFFADVNIQDCFSSSYYVPLDDWLDDVEKKVDTIFLKDTKPAAIMVDGVRYIKAGEKE